MIKFIVLCSLNMNVSVRLNVANINFFYPKDTGSIVVMKDGAYFQTAENPQYIEHIIHEPAGSSFTTEYFPKLVELARAAKEAVILNHQTGDYFQGMTAIEAALAQVEVGLVLNPEF